MEGRFWQRGPARAGVRRRGLCPGAAADLQGSERLSNDKASINRLFTIPLIFAAALLSFAHGANDVANAVGPLAAINDAILHGGIAQKASIPLWVMMVGALGIAIGLALYGPKLIRTVGTEITELDQMRAFCIAMAAALTVIVATQLRPAGVIDAHRGRRGVRCRFLREFLKATYSKMVEEIRAHHHGKDEAEVARFLMEFRKASVAKKGMMLQQLKEEHSAKADLSKKERKGLKRVYKTRTGQALGIDADRCPPG